jgi:hypothetical protein
MSVLEIERPAPEAPEVRDWFSWADIGLRALLLLVLAAAGVSLLPAGTAAARPSLAFLQDLRAHRVTVIQYHGSSRSLRWADGWQHWYVAHLDEGRAPQPPLPNGRSITVQSSGDPDNSADLTWVQQALVSSRSGLTVDDRETSANDVAAWTGDIAAHWLRVATGAALFTGFLLMLGRDRRRFANRWGWFWIIAVGGAWGVACYLLIEPMPIWWRPRQDRPFPAKPVFAGGMGLLIGLALKSAVPIAAGLLSLSLL